MVRVSARDVDLRPARTQFRVSVLDDTVETQVDRQGHGFQRALLISALKLLAQHGATAENNGVICLAIEEPELFQHPVQARAFATVLRKLAGDAEQGIQVCYATHSPYFIEPKHFEQVRRITRTSGSGPEGWGVKVSHVTLADVRVKLGGYVDPEQVGRQIDGVCLNRLADALFAERVALVEGETDQAVIEGSAEHDHDPLSVSGIVVAPVGTKSGLFLAHAIVTLLGIPCYVLFDGDNGEAARMREKGRKQADIVSAQAASAKHNRQLLTYLGASAEDWPATQVNDMFAVFEDTLETQLDQWWYAFLERKAELVDSEQGYHANNSLTYKHAATTVSGEIPAEIATLLEKIRSVPKTGGDA